MLTEKLAKKKQQQQQQKTALAVCSMLIKFLQEVMCVTSGFIVCILAPFIYFNAIKVIMGQIIWRGVEIIHFLFLYVHMTSYTNS